MLIIKRRDLYEKGLVLKLLAFYGDIFLELVKPSSAKGYVRLKIKIGQVVKYFPLIYWLEAKLVLAGSENIVNQIGHLRAVLPKKLTEQALAICLLDLKSSQSLKLFNS